MCPAPATAALESFVSPGFCGCRYFSSCCSTGKPVQASCLLFVKPCCTIEVSQQSGSEQTCFVQEWGHSYGYRGEGMHSTSQALTKRSRRSSAPLLMACDARTLAQLACTGHVFHGQSPSTSPMRMAVYASSSALYHTVPMSVPIVQCQ